MYFERNKQGLKHLLTDKICSIVRFILKKTIHTILNSAQILEFFVKFS